MTVGGFDARLASEWQHALKARQPLALLMIDVDHFKLFNDTYGHVEGDDCLRSIGKTLAKVAGVTDFAARYGGEEFALLLPSADSDTAIYAAEQLRQSVEELRIAHRPAPMRQVTVSVGVASLVPEADENAEVLVEAADAGLYAAKRRGRNAVVAHAPVTLCEAG